MPELTDQQVDVWHQRIVRSMRAKKSITNTWQLLNEYYKGQYYMEHEEVNRVSASWHLVAERQMLASLYDHHPTMFFTGRSELGNIVAPMMEGVTDFERRLIGADIQERRALRNALRYGTGIIKHAWNVEFSGPEDAWAASKKVPKSAMSGATMDISQQDATMPLSIWTEHNPFVRQGHVWTKSIHPKDFFVDSEAVVPEEARWFAHRFYRPWVDVVRDERYDKQAREEQQPTSLSDHFEGDVLHENWTDEGSEARDSSMVALFEIFDVTTKTIILVSDNSNKALQSRPYPYAHYGSPYEFVQFLPRDDSFWALPYVDTFTPQVEAMNLLRTQFMDHIERHGAVRGAYAKNRGLTQDDITKFLSQRDGFMGMDLQAGQSIDDVLSWMPYIPIASDAWRLMDVFFSDFERVSGLSDLALGSGKSIGSATEASIVQGQTGLRVGDMAGVWDDFLRGTTRKTVSLLQQFWGPQRVVPIVGSSGQQWRMQELVNSDVNAEFHVDIEPGSTQREDENVRTRQIIDAMERLMAMDERMQIQGHQVDWVELTKQFVKRIGIFRNPEKIIKAVQVPQQPGNVVDFPGQAPMQAPATVNGLGQIPNQGVAFQSGREFSQAQGV